jgi:K(+)-stimulated pyrophosphate-energized sodium pump
MDWGWIALASGVIGLIYAFLAALSTLKRDPGTGLIKEASDAVREGAEAFLKSEYKILAIFVIVVAIVLLVVGKISPSMSPWTAFAFVLGALSSMAAGYTGMSIAVRANARTTVAARESLNSGLRVAFRGGTVMGMTVVGIGLVGVCIIYFLFKNHPQFLSILPAYGMGASSVALFARVGGGIYTKGADAAADLVGKVEVGIPEDDPRNAAVIADWVGDNVGDVAGMGADLFESYVDAIIASMTLSTLAFASGLVPLPQTAWTLPLMVASSGIIASIIGVFFVSTGGSRMRDLLWALRRGTFVATGLTLLFSLLVVLVFKAHMGIWYSVLAGLIAGVIIGESTNYYTAYEYSPTQRISQAATSGGGTCIMQGFAVGMLSTWIPILVVAIALLVSYKFASYYGVAIAGVGMLSTLGISLSTDAYGPIADNAGGIAEMARLEPEVRERTDALDALGNTTAATGKGFAIGSAALTALGLLLSYGFAVGLVKVENGQFVIEGGLLASVLSAPVVAGLFIGVMLPAVFCSMVMDAVGRNAFVIVEEVRRQFREIPGLMEGKAKPDYARCVALSTQGALRRMVTPVIIAIIAPLAVGFILGKYALAGFLLGSIASGFILAIIQANAGGAWDNAKKFIEMGHFGGKGSDAHKAAIVGDTAGDPMKDAAGPSLNIMLKLMSIIALVFAPILAGF